MTTAPTADELAAALGGPEGVAAVPIVVKGRLVLPPRPAAADVAAAWRAQGEPGWFRHAGAQVLRQPIVDPATLEPTGESQFLVAADPDPRELVEDDPAALARDLARLPFASVLDYVAELRDGLDRAGPLLGAAAATTKAASSVAHPYVDAVFRAMGAMLDPQAIGEAVDRELGRDGVPGRQFLDGWVDVDATVRRGMTARLDGRDGTGAPPARLRAFPTRQLHVTAGNALVVPLVSIVRALATKGAAVVKSPSRATAAGTMLAVAVHEVGGDHPVARHLSLVYWKGGDRRVEDELFRPEAFDRLVVWGGRQAVESVAGRAGGIKTVLLKPRYGISLVGREAFAGDLAPVAARVAADVMIGNQAACNAALLVYVEAGEPAARAFCEALRAALGAWDERLPHRPSPASRGFLRRLQRGALVNAEWFGNGGWPDPTSAVVYSPQPFDVTQHPMSRLAVVRPVADLGDALEFVNPGVVTAGVYPEERRDELRDELAARGVSNVAPLGDAERAYAGMPHDGMAVLGELVNWVNG